MIIQSIDSEIWWLANADEIRSPRSFTVHDVIERFKKEFHFFTVPTTIPTGSEGYTFHQGALPHEPNQIGIRHITVYAASAHISVSGSTNDADLVLGKLTEIFESFGVRNPTTPPVKFYRSTIICDCEGPLDSLFAKHAILERIIQERSSVPEIKIWASGIAFSADPATLPAAIATYNPTLFSINRKMDIGFSTNRFTCFANMTTDNHLSALEEIERLL